MPQRTPPVDPLDDLLRQIEEAVPQTAAPAAPTDLDSLLREIEDGLAESQRKHFPKGGNAGGTFTGASIVSGTPELPSPAAGRLPITPRADINLPVEERPLGPPYGGPAGGTFTGTPTVSYDTRPPRPPQRLMPAHEPTPPQQADPGLYPGRLTPSPPVSPRRTPSRGDLSVMDRMRGAPTPTEQLRTPPTDPHAIAPLTPMPSHRPLGTGPSYEEVVAANKDEASTERPRPGQDWQQGDNIGTPLRPQDEAARQQREIDAKLARLREAAKPIPGTPAPMTPEQQQAQREYDTRAAEDQRLTAQYETLSKAFYADQAAVEASQAAHELRVKAWEQAGKPEAQFAAIKQSEALLGTLIDGINRHASEVNAVVAAIKDNGAHVTRLAGILNARGPGTPGTPGLGIQPAHTVQPPKPRLLPAHGAAPPPPQTPEQQQLAADLRTIHPPQPTTPLPARRDDIPITPNPGELAVATRVRGALLSKESVESLDRWLDVGDQGLRNLYIAAIGHPAETLTAVLVGEGYVDPKHLEDVQRRNRERGPRALASVMDDPQVMLDPVWWSSIVGQAAGSILSLASTGKFGSGLTRGAALALGVDAARIAKIAPYGGQAFAALAEAGLEGGAAYAEVMERGGTREQAGQAASDVVRLNFPFIMLTETPLFNAPTKSRLINGLVNVLGEGGQEGGQNEISNRAIQQAYDVGRDIHAGTAESAIVGAISGPIAGELISRGQRALQRGTQAPPEPRTLDEFIAAVKGKMAEPQAVVTWLAVHGSTAPPAEVKGAIARLEELTAAPPPGREAPPPGGEPPPPGAPPDAGTPPPAPPSPPTAPPGAGGAPPKAPTGPVPVFDDRDKTEYVPGVLPGLYKGQRVTHTPTGHTGTIVEWFQGAGQQAGQRDAFRIQWDTGETTLVNQSMQLQFDKWTPPADTSATFTDEQLAGALDPTEREALQTAGFSQEEITGIATQKLRDSGAAPIDTSAPPSADSTDATTAGPAGDLGGAPAGDAGGDAGTGPRRGRGHKARPTTPRPDKVAREAEAHFPRVVEHSRADGFTGTDEELRAKYDDRVESVRRWIREVTGITAEHGDAGFISDIIWLGGLQPFVTDYIQGAPSVKLREEFQGIVDGFKRNHGLFGARSPFRSDGWGLDGMLDNFRAHNLWPEIRDEHDLMRKLDELSRKPKLDETLEHDTNFLELIEAAAGVKPGSRWWEEGDEDTSIERKDTYTPDELDAIVQEIDPDAKLTVAEFLAEFERRVGRPATVQEADAMVGAAEGDDAFDVEDDVSDVSDVSDTPDPAPPAGPAEPTDPRLRTAYKALRGGDVQWDERRVYGMTDAEILLAISDLFGISGGYGGDVQYSYKGGKHPTLTIKVKDKETTYKKKTLAALAREVLAIGPPKLTAAQQTAIHAEVRQLLRVVTHASVKMVTLPGEAAGKRRRFPVNSDYRATYDRQIADGTARVVKLGAPVDGTTRVTLMFQGSVRALDLHEGGAASQAPKRPSTGPKTPSPTKAAAEPTTEQKPDREFASTQFDLPQPHADHVRQLAATIKDEDLADDGREDQPHLTIKFGLVTDNADDVAALVATFGPVTITLGKVSIFSAKESGNDYDVLKIEVESDDLRRLNATIGTLDNGDTHPTYQPHITLAYVKPGAGQKYVGAKSPLGVGTQYVGNKRLQGRRITLTAVTFSHKNRTTSTIPLGSKKDALPVTPKAEAAETPVWQSTTRWTADAWTQKAQGKKTSPRDMITDYVEQTWGLFGQGDLIESVLKATKKAATRESEKGTATSANHKKKIAEWIAKSQRDLKEALAEQRAAGIPPPTPPKGAKGHVPVTPKAEPGPPLDLGITQEEGAAEKTPLQLRIEAVERLIRGFERSAREGHPEAIEGAQYARLKAKLQALLAENETLRTDVTPKADDDLAEKQRIHARVEELYRELGNPFGDRDDFSAFLDTATEDLSLFDLRSALKELEDLKARRSSGPPAGKTGTVTPITPKADAQDGDTSPFTTPGTNLTWGSGQEWADAFREIHGRKISSNRHKQERAHVAELAKHPDFIAAQGREDLHAIRDLIQEQRHNSEVVPVKGKRKDSPYETIVNEVNNALARLDAQEAREEDVAEPPGVTERRRHKELEALATDEAMGVKFPKNKPSVFPDGSEAVMCTNCARRILQLVGSGDIYGWKEETNPTAIVADQAGHDFAVIDGRYLVDAWAKNVEGSTPRAVFDLDDAEDRAEVRRLYGDPKTWLRAKDGFAHRLIFAPGHPAQLDEGAAPAAVDPLDDPENVPEDLTTLSEKQLDAAFDAATAKLDDAFDEEADTFHAAEDLVERLQAEIDRRAEAAPSMTPEEIEAHGAENRAANRRGAGAQPLPPGERLDVQGYRERYWYLDRVIEQINELKAQAQKKPLKKADAATLKHLEKTLANDRDEAAFYHRLDTHLVDGTGWLDGEDNLQALSDLALERMEYAAKARARLEGRAGALESFDDDLIEKLHDEDRRRRKAEDAAMPRIDGTGQPRPKIPFTDPTAKDATKKEPAKIPLFTHEGQTYIVDPRGYITENQAKGLRVVPIAEYTGRIGPRTYHKYYERLRSGLPWEYGGDPLSFLDTPLADLVAYIETQIDADMSRGNDTGVIYTINGQEYVATGEQAIIVVPKEGAKPAAAPKKAKGAIPVTPKAEKKPAPPALSAQPVVFRSGNTRSPADLEGYITAGHPVGVTAEASDEIIRRLVEYLQAGGTVFIDSGAFQVFTHNLRAEPGQEKPDVEFDFVFDTYEAVADDITKAQRQHLYIVGPDKIGDSKATRDLQYKYLGSINALLQLGVRVILPVQVGDQIADDAARIVATFPKAAIGIPSNEAAMSLDELHDMLDALKAEGLTPAGVHFLGMGDRNPRFPEFVSAVRRRFPEAAISADSNRTRSLMAPGRPAHTAAKDATETRAEGLVDVEWTGDTTELTGNLFRGELDDFTPGELQKIAAAADLSLATIRQAAREDRLGQVIEDTGLEEAVYLAIHDIAKARMVKKASPGARSDAIAQHDKGTPPVSDRLIEEQPRLPGSEGARAPGKPTTFQAPAQATDDRFNLENEETPEAKQRAKDEQKKKDDDGRLFMRREDEPTGHYEIVESRSERERRVQGGYTRIVRVVARAFQRLWEQHEGHPLAWNKGRTENLNGLIGTVNAYPIVTSTFRGGVDVGDGRHRIALAASRGQTIDVATQPGTVLPPSVLAHGAPQTPAFRAWFKNSKVVDAQGQPLVVYHGTMRGEFEAFDSEGGTRAFYFTPMLGYADMYASGSVTGEIPVRGKSKVYAVYLSLQNPLIIGSAERGSTDDPDSQWTFDVEPERVAELKAQGYDGIINYDGDEIIAFEPTQIKSATENRGSYDPTDARINFMRRQDDDGPHFMRRSTPVAAFVNALGRDDVETLLGVMDDLQLAKNGSITMEGVSDRSRSTGRPGPRVPVSFDDVVAWIKSPAADTASTDPEWPTLLFRARSALGIAPTVPMWVRGKKGGPFEKGGFWTLPTGERGYGLTPEEAQEQMRKAGIDPLVDDEADAPQYMRLGDLFGKGKPKPTPEQRAAEGDTEMGLDVNIDHLLTAMGPQMYDKPIVEVAVKELVQNSFDAVRDLDATDDKPGHIDVTLDAVKRTVTVKDDGIGMTPEILKKAFFTIAGTHKQGKPENTSGGLGLAKMVFLLGSERVRVETTRDGMTSTIEVTSDEIRASARPGAPKFTVKTVHTGKPSGTTVSAVIPAEFTDANGEKRHIGFTDNPQFLNMPLLGPVVVTLNGKTLDLGVHTKGFQKENEFHFSWGTIHVYVDPKQVQVPWVRVLSAGLFQFNHAAFMWGQPHLPYTLLLDVRPKVRTNNPAYPFNNTREGFRSTIRKDIEAMNTFLQGMAIEQNLLEAKETFRTLKQMPKVDIDKKWTDEEMAAFERDHAKRQRAAPVVPPRAVKSVAITGKTVTITYTSGTPTVVTREEYVPKSFTPKKDIDVANLGLDVSALDPSHPNLHNNTNLDYEDVPGAVPLLIDLGNVLIRFMREWGTNVMAKGVGGGTNYAQLANTTASGWFGGISFDKGYRGLNMVKPFNAIWINPIGLSREAMQSPAAAASEILHLMIHEITHVEVRTEGASFTAELANNYARIRAAEIRVEFFEHTLERMLRERWAALKELNERFTDFNTKNRGESFKSSAPVGPERPAPGRARDRASEVDPDRAAGVREAGRRRDRGADPADRSAGVGAQLAGRVGDRRTAAERSEDTLSVIEALREQIDGAYERGAPGAQVARWEARLDALEEAAAARAEALLEWDADNADEIGQLSAEEQLAVEYWEQTVRNRRPGVQDHGGGMEGALARIKEALGLDWNLDAKTVNDDELLAAAKDAYEAMVARRDRIRRGRRDNAAMRRFLEQHAPHLRDDGPQFMRRQDQPRGYKVIAAYLNEDERTNEKSNIVAAVLKIFTRRLPKDIDWRSAAKAGRVARDWYVRSHNAIRDLIGDADTPRFITLLAALSPRIEVQDNLLHTARAWFLWNAEGRPGLGNIDERGNLTVSQEQHDKDYATIVDILRRSVRGKGLESSVLDSWRNNAVEALCGVDPLHIVLSGPKVDSFGRNLLGFVQEVTNDIWIAIFSNVEQGLFDGKRYTTVPTGLRRNPGKGPGYLAVNAKQRRVARQLTIETGELWTPDQVQATVWVWTKTLYDLATKHGLTAVEVLKQGKLTDKVMASAPDFANVITGETSIRAIFEAAGYGPQIRALDQTVARRARRVARRAAQDRRAAHSRGGRARRADRQATIALFRSARRLDRVRAQREKDAIADKAKKQAKKDAAAAAAAEAAAAAPAPDDDGPRFMRAPDHPAFYSRLIRAVEESKADKQSGLQWKGTIKNAKGGINTDEYALVSVDDLEDGKPYTKAEVLAYLRLNEVTVEEVVLGEPVDPDELSDGPDITLIRNAGYDVTEADLFGDDEDRPILTFRNGDEIGPQDDVPASVMAAFVRLTQLASTQTHYGGYQIAGADKDSYREVLLLAPEQASAFDPSKATVDRRRGGRVIVNYAGAMLASYNEHEPRPDAYWIETAKKEWEDSNPTVGNWRDGHSHYRNYPNPIVRLRFNVRTVNGQRILFLEEIQPPQKHQQKKMPPLFTKNWREIAFKWALWHAASKNLDGIAWTTGQEQVDRWGVERAVTSIKWSHYDENDGGGQLQEVAIVMRRGGTLHFDVGSDGMVRDARGIDGAGRLNNEDLDEVVGPAIARQIRDTSALPPKPASVWDTATIKQRTLIDGHTQKYWLEAPSGEKLTHEMWSREAVGQEAARVREREDTDNRLWRSVAGNRNPNRMRGHGKIEGEGLKIGGAGLKRLYDVDFPAVVNRLGVMKKAGVRVTATSITKPRKAKGPGERQGHGFAWRSVTRSTAMAALEHNADNVGYVASDGATYTVGSLLFRAGYSERLIENMTPAKKIERLAEAGYDDGDRFMMWDRFTPGDQIGVGDRLGWESVDTSTHPPPAPTHQGIAITPELRARIFAGQPRFARETPRQVAPGWRDRAVREVEGLGIVYNDGTLTPEQLAELAADPAVQTAAAKVRAVLADLLALFPEIQAATPHLGVLFEAGAYGVHVTKITETKKNGIFLNILEALIAQHGLTARQDLNTPLRTPDTAGQWLINVAFHEMAHHTVSTEDEDLLWEINRLQGIVGVERMAEFGQRFAAALQQGGLRGLVTGSGQRLAPGLSTAVRRYQTYLGGRGRAATTPRGAGRYASRPTDERRDEGEVPGAAGRDRSLPVTPRPIGMVNPNIPMAHPGPVGPSSHLPRPPRGGTPTVPVSDRMRPSAIIKKLQEALQVTIQVRQGRGKPATEARIGALPVSVGRFRQKAYGIYKQGPQAVRVALANDLQTIAHEDGHHIDHAILRIDRKDARWKAELLQMGQATSRPTYTQAQVLLEGAAEFFRHYLMEPGTARRLAPQYFAEFERRLAHPKHATLKKLLLDARKDLQDLISQNPATRGKLRIDFKGHDPNQQAFFRKLRENPRGLWRETNVSWSDELHAIWIAFEEMRAGRDVDPRHHAYVLARIAAGTAGMAEGFLEYGPRGRNGRFIAGSFKDALMGVRDRLEEFAGYMVAVRVLEVRHLKDKETGMSVEEAEAIIAEVSSAPDYQAIKDARDKLYAYQQGLLRYAREFHAMSPQQLAKLNKELFYVPLQRVMEGVNTAFTGTGSARKIANRTVPIKRLKGSGLDIVNPLESIIRNTFAMIDMVEKNEAMLALVNMARRAAGSGKWIQLIPTPQVATLFDLKQVEKQVREQVEDAIGEELPDNFELEGLATVFTPATFALPGKNMVTVMRDGKREFYEVKNQELFDALTVIGTKASTELVRWIEKPAQWLRAGATLTPGFITRNPTRDTVVAFLQSRYGFIPVYDTVRGFISLAMGDESARLFFTSGVQQSSLVGLDRDRLRKKINGLSEAGKRDFLKRWLLHPIDLLRALSENFETATRLGEFRLVLNAGGHERTPGVLGIAQRLMAPNRRSTREATLVKATLAARDVTTDFSRGGKWSRQISRVDAFFNARVQGYIRMGETIKHDPAAALLNVTLLGLVSYALWWLNYDDEEYEEIPDWEKNSYWHVPVAGGFWKVAKPFEWAYPANLVEAGLSYVQKRDPAALERIKPDDAKGLAMSVVPSVLLPLVEAFGSPAGYDTFRRKHIVSPWDVGKDAELMKSDWTTATGETLGKLMNVSPAKIDHLIFGYGAGAARGVVEYAVDPALRAMGVAPKRSTEPSMKWQRVPVAGTFYREKAVDGGAQSLRTFYALVEEMDGFEDSMADYSKANPARGRARLAEAQGRRFYQRAQALKDARVELKALGGDINAVYANRTMTPAQKRQALDAIYEDMVSIARTAIGKTPLERRARP